MIYLYKFKLETSDELSDLFVELEAPDFKNALAKLDNMILNDVLPPYATPARAYVVNISSIFTYSTPT